MKYLEKEIELSRDNILNNNASLFGCVIVRNNKIISTGVNSVTKDNDPIIRNNKNSNDMIHI
jgi:deoxycytidylate deaminase